LFRTENLVFEHLTYGRALPAPLLDVMEKLRNLFGEDLVVTSLDSQGAKFYVRRLTNEVVIRTLMARTSEVFGARVAAGGSCALGPADFGIFSPLATEPASALTLSYVPNLPAGSVSGFWYS
jgi:hypothetical protein